MVTTITDSYASCTGSVYDAIINGSTSKLLPGSVTDCSVNPSWLNSYEDQYLNFDLLAAIYPDVAQFGWYSGTQWYDIIPLIGMYDPLAYTNWVQMVNDQINPPKQSTSSGSASGPTGL